MCCSYMPSGCTATFTVSYTQKNAGLRIMDKFCLQHNHERSSELFEHYPKHRKLTESQKSTVTEFLQCDPSNRGLLRTVHSRFGKSWTLTDLKNFKQKGVYTVKLILNVGSQINAGLVQQYTVVRVHRFIHYFTLLCVIISYRQTVPCL